MGIGRSFDFHDFLMRADRFHSDEEFRTGAFGWLWHDDLFKGNVLSSVVALLVSEPIYFKYKDCNFNTGLIERYNYSSDGKEKEINDINVEMFCFIKGYDDNGLKLADLFVTMSDGDLRCPVFFQISFGSYYRFLLDSDRDNKRYILGTLGVGEKRYPISNKYNVKDFSDFTSYELEKFKEILGVYPYIEKTFFGTRFVDANWFKEITEAFIDVFNEEDKRRSMSAMRWLIDACRGE